MTTDQAAEIIKGQMIDVTIRRPGKRSYTYRWAELVNRDLDGSIPWIAIWQHARGKFGRGAVLVVGEIETVTVHG